MKKTVKILAAALILALTACESIKENLVMPISINNRELSFSVNESAELIDPIMKVKSQSQAEVLLYDNVLNINITGEAKGKGMDMDRVTALDLTEASLELESPAGFNMGIFNKLKLYIGDRTNLVAQAERVDGSKVFIKIANADLLSQLKDNDNIRVILTGEQRPTKKVNLKLKTSYKAKIRLLK